MSRHLEPVAEWTLKLAAINLIGARDLLLPLPVSIPQVAFAGVTALLVQPTGRLRAPFVDTIGWRHGGINE
jgi:hypothetical protein